MIQPHASIINPTLPPPLCPSPWPETPPIPASPVSTANSPLHQQAVASLLALPSIALTA